MSRAGSFNFFNEQTYYPALTTVSGLAGLTIDEVFCFITDDAKNMIAQAISSPEGACLSSNNFRASTLQVFNKYIKNLNPSNLIKQKYFPKTRRAITWAEFYNLVKNSYRKLSATEGLVTSKALLQPFSFDSFKSKDRFFQNFKLETNYTSQINYLPFIEKDFPRVILTKLISEYEYHYCKSAFRISPSHAVAFLSSDTCPQLLTEQAVNSLLEKLEKIEPSVTIVAKRNPEFNIFIHHLNTCYGALYYDNSNITTIRENLFDAICYLYGIEHKKQGKYLFKGVKRSTRNNQTDFKYFDLFKLLNDACLYHMIDEKNNNNYLEVTFLNIVRVIFNKNNHADNYNGRSSKEQLSNFNELCILYILSYALELAYWAKNQNPANDNSTESSIFDWNNYLVIDHWNQNREPILSISKSCKLKSNVFRFIQNRCSTSLLCKPATPPDKYENLQTRDIKYTAAEDSSYQYNIIFQSKNSAPNLQSEQDRQYQERLKFERCIVSDITHIKSTHEAYKSNIVSNENVTAKRITPAVALLGSNNMPEIHNIYIYNRLNEKVFHDTVMDSYYETAKTSSKFFNLLCSEFVQICTAVQCFHEQNYVHHNIQPKNILDHGKNLPKKIRLSHTTLPCILSQELHPTLYSYLTNSPYCDYKNPEYIVKNNVEFPFDHPAKSHYHQTASIHNKTTLVSYDIYSLIMTLLYMTLGNNIFAELMLLLENDTKNTQPDTGIINYLLDHIGIRDSSMIKRFFLHKLFLYYLSFNYEKKSRWPFGDISSEYDSTFNPNREPLTVNELTGLLKNNLLDSQISLISKTSIPSNSIEDREKHNLNSTEDKYRVDKSKAIDVFNRLKTNYSDLLTLGLTQDHCTDKTLGFITPSSYRVFQKTGRQATYGILKKYILEHNYINNNKSLGIDYTTFSNTQDSEKLYCTFRPIHIKNILVFYAIDNK